MSLVLIVDSTIASCVMYKQCCPLSNVNEKMNATYRWPFVTKWFLKSLQVKLYCRCVVMLYSSQIALEYCICIVILHWQNEVTRLDPSFRPTLIEGKTSQGELSCSSWNKQVVCSRHDSHYQQKTGRANLFFFVVLIFHRIASVCTIIVVLISFQMPCNAATLWYLDHGMKSQHLRTAT